MIFLRPVLCKKNKKEKKKRKKKRIAVPVEKDRFNQRHHVSTCVVSCTHDGHVDGLWRS